MLFLLSSISEGAASRFKPAGRILCAPMIDSVERATRLLRAFRWWSAGITAPSLGRDRKCGDDHALHRESPCFCSSANAVEPHRMLESKGAKKRVTH